MKEVDPRFYQVVNEKLKADAMGMIEDAHAARKAAEGCGCPQCVGWAERADMECEVEAWRITRQPEFDHEEEWLMHQALIKLQEKNEE